MTYVLSGTLTNQPQPAENLLPENAMIYPTPKAQCNCSKVLNISNEKNISITVVTEDGRTYLFTSADDNNVDDDMMMMLMMMCPHVSS